MLVLAEIACRSGHSFDLSYDPVVDPVLQLQRTAAFVRSRPDQIQKAAAYVQHSFGSPLVQSVLNDMAGKPGHFMWPWDGAAPHSLAHGILDDVTYDWYYLLKAVLASDGRSEILTEDSIRRAYDMAHRHTGIPVCPTGASGLAGLIHLQASGAIDPGEAVGLFSTGFDRTKTE